MSVATPPTVALKQKSETVVSNHHFPTGLRSNALAASSVLRSLNELELFVNANQSEKQSLLSNHPMKLLILAAREELFSTPINFLAERLSAAEYDLKRGVGLRTRFSELLLWLLVLVSDHGETKETFVEEDTGVDTGVGAVMDAGPHTNCSGRSPFKRSFISS